MATVTLLRVGPLPPLRTLPTRRLHTSSPDVRPPFHLRSTAKIPPLRPISASYQPAVPATDRLVAAMAYSLPFLNSLHYGRFLFARFPATAAAVKPVLPLVAAYRSVPFAAFAAFFALYLGVVRNPAFSRYVRFNAMQAVVLDVLLALPTLVQRVVGSPPARGLGFQALMFGYDAVFVFAAACFVYSVLCSVLGGTPHLPLVAAAANRQL